jgi:hypothetical protein
MSHVIATFGRREQAERDRDEVADLVETSRARGPQERFEFGEGEFNRIEVRTVGRQKSELRARRFDRLPDLGLLVGGEVVEDDDVAAPQRGREDLFNVGEKRRIVDRPIEHGRRAEPLEPQRGDHRVHLPVAARGVIAQARAPRTPAVTADQIGRDAALVEKDVLPHIAEREPGAPPASFSDDVGAPLFVGVYGFF